ncbi:GntR family transcriptional regulator [Dyadobacter luteus]|jgi:DNA-binding transcriptional regulator YhcF (GntR family)|uniref:GntR family transcriptional regulator n=1 Tax=Dyadobacter luteus TaxID=2259619 RepID=A0A3D8YDG9_9BACT|nr:GntR family transcriptional regulator [Dyadobacter luteus]REA62514.1 GntR family transcriptional regulator [Dyadobacter luteus]
METQFDIEFKESAPKYMQIIKSLLLAISKGKLKRGDKIPSINQLSEEYLLSRDTVEKAYKHLIKDGVLVSARGKGYFINRVDIENTTRILLVFNKISNYKKQIYNAFVDSMGPNVNVDLHIHHSNVNIFRNLIQNSLGEYDNYVVMPHFYENSEEALEVLKLIPGEKLILLDKDIEQLSKKHSAVYQNYEKDIVYALNQAVDLLKSYHKIILIFPSMIPYPKDIIKGFRIFCIQHHFEHEIIYDFHEDSQAIKNAAYVSIEENDLVNLIKKCREQKLVVGKDIGIISYNETPLKEILLDGITTISTDHDLMGRTAAEMIKTNRQALVKNPFTLIRRKSL